tara:strand:- start:44 stop:556 length:513 start_codon:yes stop_codon:yes gene_type:complete
MALELLPDGTFKKLSKAQTDALNRYYKRENKRDLPTEAIISGLPIILGVTIASIAYVFRDDIKERALTWLEEGTIPVGFGIAKLFTRFTRGEKNTPTEPMQSEVTIQGNVLSKCQRYEADYVNQNAIGEEIPFGFGTVLQALGQLSTIENMKLEGCSKPSIIPQSQWDQG